MPEPSPRESSLRRVLRDPVARFVLIGGLIFGAHHALRARLGAGDRVVVSTRFVEGLRAQHRQRFGRAPSPSETNRLVDDFVKEEALVREAMALGLDRGDPIVRRRLVQKMQMVLRGNLTIARPDDAACRAWIAEHRDEVALDERFSFRQAFASRDRRGSAASADSTAWVAALRDAPDPLDALGGLGDAFALGPEVTRRSGADVERQFGTRFRQALEDCAVMRPCGPIESNYGFHAIVVTAREPSGTLPFAQARPIAERSLLRDREEAALGRAIADVVRRYGVERVDDRGAR